MSCPDKDAPFHDPLDCEHCSRSNRSFKFFVEVLIEAPDREQAKQEMQRRLDNGNLTLDTVSEWLMEENPENRCPNCNNGLETFKHQCPYNPEHSETIYGCWDCDDNCEHCKDQEIKKVTECSICGLDLQDFVHQCDQNHNVEEKHGCPRCDDNCVYCIDSDSIG